MKERNSNLLPLCLNPFFLPMYLGVEEKIVCPLLGRSIPHRLPIFYTVYVFCPFQFLTGLLLFSPKHPISKTTCACKITKIVSNTNFYVFIIYRLELVC